MGCASCITRVRPALRSATRLASSSGPGWLHEAKLDCWRIQIVKDRAGVALYSRKGIDLADRFRDFAEACNVLQARSCSIDGMAEIASDQLIKKANVIWPLWLAIQFPNLLQRGLLSPPSWLTMRPQWAIADAQCRPVL